MSNLLHPDSLGFVSIAYGVAYAVSYAVAKYFRYKPCLAARTESLFSLVFTFIDFWNSFKNYVLDNLLE